MSPLIGWPLGDPELLVVLRCQTQFWGEPHVSRHDALRLQGTASGSVAAGETSRTLLQMGKKSGSSAWLSLSGGKVCHCDHGCLCGK